MTTRPIRPQPVVPSAQWYGGSSTCNRAYLLAGVRAGLIALLLLAALVGIALL